MVLKLVRLCHLGLNSQIDRLAPQTCLYVLSGWFVTLKTRMTQLNNFGDLNEGFSSLETEMTQNNKFENLNGRFMSLGIRLIHLNKFKDRWCTLLYVKFFSPCLLVEIYITWEFEMTTWRMLAISRDDGQWVQIYWISSNHIHIH